MACPQHFSRIRNIGDELDVPTQVPAGADPELIGIIGKVA